MALEQLVAEALAPHHPSQRVTQLALTVLDYGVWRWLRQRGLDEAAELVAPAGVRRPAQRTRPQARSSQRLPSQDLGGSRASAAATAGTNPAA
jgi:hypothetical protein